MAAVAAQLGVTRQSISNWLDRYLIAPTPRALSDHRGHAHVTAWDEDLLAVLLSTLERPPGQWGYRDLEWTVPLLRQHLTGWDGRRWSRDDPAHGSWVFGRGNSCTPGNPGRGLGIWQREQLHDG